MTPIKSLNRFLSALLGVINILTIAPVAAIVFAASKERLDGIVIYTYGDTINEYIIIGLAALFAVIAVAMFNGSIATLLSIESNLRRQGRQGEMGSMPAPKNSPPMRSMMMPDSSATKGDTEAPTDDATKTPRKSKKKRKAKASAKAKS